MTQQPQDQIRSEPPDQGAATAAVAVPAPARMLALIGAGLAIVYYLLGFFGDIGSTTDLVGPLVIGGGLLAGSVAIRRASGVLVPAAVAVTVGVLILLQSVATGGASGILIGALIIAFLETVAVAGAVLLDAGIVTAPARSPKARQGPPPAWPPDQQAWGQGRPAPYGQAGYPPGYGQPYPGQLGYGAPAAGQPASQAGQPAAPGYPPAGYGAAPGYPPSAGAPSWGQPAAPPAEQAATWPGGERQAPTGATSLPAESTSGAKTAAFGPVDTGAGEGRHKQRDEDEPEPTRVIPPAEFKRD